MKRTTANFRIATRAEGPLVNAYLAPMESMEGAILIGCVPRAVCNSDSTVFDEFLELMKRVASVASVAAFGQEPIAFRQQDVPEHEKVGHA